jgi:methenyltetrahydromethanopterin cyclohydrolase
MVVGVSVNAKAAALVSQMILRADELRIGVAKGELGETLIDAGANNRGGVTAGRLIAEICMGGLGDISLTLDSTTPRWPWAIVVQSSDPVTACLASQYAGWRLSHGEGRDAFFALGSGPARALARKEALFSEISYADAAQEGVLVIESSRPPPTAIVAKVASDCGLAPERLTVIYAPTQSLAGGCQVVARALEVALHKAHELKFPLERVVDGMAAAPIPPPHPDFVAAMGRTNDAIIYGGKAHLFVEGAASDAKTLAEHLPSATSRDYGRPFAELFRQFKGDFYAIDPRLFSPAEVIVTAVQSGESFHAGRCDSALLNASFSG